MEQTAKARSRAPGGSPVEGKGRQPTSRRKPELLEQMRDALWSRRYSRFREKTQITWVKRFIFFHHVRHPAQMGEAEVNAFLRRLAVNEKVGGATQNRALSALLFLYCRVIGREVSGLDRNACLRRHIDVARVSRRPPLCPLASYTALQIRFGVLSGYA